MREYLGGTYDVFDHILLSPGFRASTGLRAPMGSGTIPHAQFLAQTVNGGQHREDAPAITGG